MFKEKSIGIIGGAGPMASCLLYQLIIEECQKTYGCTRDDHFPKIFVLNYPFSEMILDRVSKQNRRQLKTELDQCLQLLHRIEADRIGIACNTLHTILDPQTTEASNLILIQVPVLRQIHKAKIKTVLVLATETTIKSRFYDGIANQIIIPPDSLQGDVTAVIDAVLKGEITQSWAFRLDQVIARVRSEYSFEAVLLGCTELSVLNHRFPLSGESLFVIDPLVTLSQALLKPNQVLFL